MHRVVGVASNSPVLGGYHKSRRCSRDAYPESYITKYTSILVYDECIQLTAETVTGASFFFFFFFFVTLKPRVE